MRGTFRLGAARVSLAALLVVAGCGGAECVERTTQYTASATGVGYVGPTLGKPVVRVDLTQDFVSHTPYEACVQGPLFDVGVVRATVTNISTTPLQLQFDIQGLNAAGLMVWDLVKRVERIMPNETVDLGQVGISEVHVDAGAKVVLTEVTILP